MSDNLDDVRQNIDKLDNKILDLLMERAELIRDVSAIKRKFNKPIVHPAREAMMMRRLLDRHEGILPQSAVIGIWRELVGAVSMLQRGLRAYASTEGNQDYCWDMAKDYCGSVIPMFRSEKNVLALSFARDDKDAVAVLPWPEDNDENPWWLMLADQGDNQSDLYPIQIIVALPFGNEKPLNHLEQKALMAGRMQFLPSGDDHSFIVIKVDGPLSRARTIDLLKEQGIEAISIVTHKDDDTGSTAHLIEVNGYVETDDSRLAALAEAQSEINAKCRLIGGFPVPPILRANDTAPL